MNRMKNQFDSLKACVLIPTYNNSTTLATVILSVLEYTDNVMIVNDGSTDNTAKILDDFKQIKVIHFNQNRGKGTALRHGFKEAMKLGYKYAITMDSDGQHYAKDLLVFLESIEKFPDSILIGSRNLDQENVPGTSSFGNSFSNFWFKVETGKSLPDTQSGYRVYPLERLKRLTFFTWRYEFEIEVLVRSSWNGVPIVPINIDVYYPPKNERISHFRKGPDFTRISILNTFLVFWALIWIHPRDFILNLPRHLKWFWKQQIIASHESNLVKAVSLGFGVFMGIIPVWGFQMIIATFFAHVFKLNKVMTLLASNVSFPPFIPVVMYLSLLTGKFVLGKSTHVNVANLQFKNLGENIGDYLLGSLLLSVVSGLAIFLISFLLLSLLRKDSGISKAND